MPSDVRAVFPAGMHLVHSSDTSYPGDLARLIHKPVLNYGVDGETTTEGLTRLRHVLRTIRPSSVVLLEGTSDLMAGQGPLSVAYRLLRMAATIRQSGARPILLTVLPPDGPHWVPLRNHVEVLNGLLRSGAKVDHVTVVDSAATFAAHKPLAAFFRHHDGREDGIHPNDTGYRVLAVLVYQAIGHA
jgi:lysophospholipase L1-like esterase